MKDKNDNPLKNIFIKSPKGELTEEIESVKNIPSFFSYLKDENKREEIKIKLIEDLIAKIKVNRYITEYFSEYENKSVYLVLFDIYLSKFTSKKFKEAIVHLLNALRVNIQAGKDIYEYIFQHLSSYYRGEKPITADIMGNHLKLLQTILGETEGHLTPKNYFSCSGGCKFIVDLNKKVVDIGKGFTIVINFKISVNNQIEPDPEKNRVSNLIKIFFSSNKSLSIDLQYPLFLVVKEIRQEFIKQFPSDEWVNLIVTLSYTDKLQFYFYVNGENHAIPFTLSNLNVTAEDSVNYIEFFNNFYGEVSSISMFSLKDKVCQNLINSGSFLSEFKNYKEGLWKKKRIDNFFDFIQGIQGKPRSSPLRQSSGPVETIRTSLSNKLNLRTSTKIEEKKPTLYDGIIFVFTPINYNKENPKLVDDVFLQYQLQFNGNIRNHQFTNYQKHLVLVCEFNNFFPIAEMFIIYPETLNENNLQLFLKIIVNMFNYRKNNIKCVKQYKFFEVLCLFIEKFPNHVFTENILNAFYSLAKTLFINNQETICSNYFKHILLNEKILSKYNENLIVQFFNKLFLFCQSDSSQIETFINMNRLCLILRFYDRNKYTEMCCEEHLDMFKPEYVLSKKIMKPSMPKKLSYLKNIMDLIIASQEATNSIDLFKLLTLDLSPCLTKFILNIFINAMENVSKNEVWKDTFVQELLKSKYEVIIINTFLHALPDVKLDILKFIYIIHQRLVASKRTNSFKTFEKMIKTCLLPEKMFYTELPNSDSKGANNDANKKKEEIIKAEEPKKKEGIEGAPPKTNGPNEAPHGRASKVFLDLVSKFDKNQNDSKNMSNKKYNNYTTIDEEENTCNNIIYDKSTNQVVVIKDEIVKGYIDSLFKYFFLWALSMNIDYPVDAINLDRSLIKNSNTLEILFLLDSKIRNITFTNNYLKSIEKLSNNNENAYLLFFNKKILSSILDVTFIHYKKPGKSSEICYETGKSILSKIYTNSIGYLEKIQNMCASSEIETLFIWGNKVTSEDESDKTKKLLFEFLYEIFLDFLNQFKAKFDNKMKFDIKDQNSDPKKNFFVKNYLILFSELFYFIFLYKLDYKIYTKSIKSLYSSSPKIELPEVLITSMRMNDSLGDKLSSSWLDFQLIYDIFHRLQYIWGNTNVYKKLILNRFKNNKTAKYDYLIENIILDKESKNLYQKELEILCYEEIKGDKEIMKPLIKIIPITFMCILSKLKIGQEENDFKYWLKEYKNFLKFIIIASSNLIKLNQEDIYKTLQDKCLEVLTTGLVFLTNLVTTTKICKPKAEKALFSIFLFCFKLVKYQYGYISKHSGLFTFTSKAPRNDLSGCAIFILFTEYVKAKAGEPLLTTSYLETISADKMQNACLIMGILRKPEWKDAFYENQTLKAKINNNVFCLDGYNSLVEYRYTLIPFLSDEFDESYKKKILTLLPQYEEELVKYSNNSLEKNIKIKNAYKISKKNAFSWRGYWCYYKMFFENISQFKIKLVNHYTKTLMKPILVPILDVSYYLPEFSGFNTDKLFKEPDENQKLYVVNMDIDKALKISESNTSTNIKEDSNKDLIKYNYLRSIYSKSSKELDEILSRISNNLEFGKEEEFSFVERQSNNNQQKPAPKTKKYYLCCIVKTSHHIKGVCFIDNKKRKLNFKVFLNQKTGNAMSDVEIGFTTEDDDYDQERHTCFGSYFVCRPRDKDIYKISINYDDIKWIFRRKYYYTNSAFEIYTYSNKTYYFNFKYENEREIVLDELVKQMDLSQIIDDLKDVKDKESINYIIGFENDVFDKENKEDNKDNIFSSKLTSTFNKVGDNKKKKLKLSKILKSWKQWEITNFELLMWLNIFGNRSFNDLSQYPVFPWTLSNYNDPLQEEQKEKNNDDSDTNQKSTSFSVSSLLSNITINDDDEEALVMGYKYRDLKLPMGMLELNDDGTKRKEIFIDTYDTLKSEPDENMKPYVFGSNYSNPVYVCNFLMRIFPFTNISIELQGHKFDDPHRLFLSVKDCFHSCTTQQTDLRELIPEFFYLPEMFLNLNHLNMGCLENGVFVNNVLTPCNDNPFDFITTMKTVLENNRLSYTLQNWIDLIFGYKSKGKDAETAHNIFTEASYQEVVDINKVNNKESFLRMVEFGLIPTQILSKDCIKKDKKMDIKKGKEITDPTCKIKSYKCKYRNESDNFISSNVTVLKFASFTPEKVILLLSNSYIIEKKISYSNFEKVYYDEQPILTQLTKYPNRMPEIYSPKESNNKAIQFCNHGKVLVMGGFYDGKILLIPIENKNDVFELVPFSDKSPIVSISIDKEENFAFVGNSIGNIRIIKIDPDITQWKILNIISDHLTAISHIDCNSELNLWASASIDGYINIYTLPLSKLIRSVKIPFKKCSYVFLSASPLPSIIALGESENGIEIIAYSINGNLIKRQKVEAKLICPIIIKDLNSNEYLTYIINDSIVIRSLPNLFIQTSINNIQDAYAIYPSEDMKMLYVASKSGGQIYIVRDESKK